MGQDAIHALWVDPLAFEPMENGAPYLPEKLPLKMARESDAVLGSVVVQMPKGVEYPELGALVAILRAATIVHQSHHWQTRGDSYYGDHLMFERLYNESLGFIDQIAERAVGLGGEALVDPRLQAGLIPPLVTQSCMYSASPSPLEMVVSSLGVEQCVVSCLVRSRASLSERGLLSSGTDNLIQGVADKHEEFVYLLQQRHGGKTAYSYDSR